MIATYPNTVKIYTDGSKIGKAVGAAAVLGNEEVLWRLPESSSIFSAEAMAIIGATQIMQDMDEDKFVICTDSLSVLLTLEKLYDWSDSTNCIRNELYKCKSLGKNVSFIWTPSHSGISGNENADKAAKNALDLNVVCDMKLNAREVMSILNEHIKIKWKERWNQCGQKLGNIKLGIDRWKSIDGMGRRDQVILTRLRLGHTRITYSHIFEQTDSPSCSACGECFTVNHLLFECPRNADIRHNLKIRPNDLGNDFEGNKRILTFINEAGFRYEI